MKVQTYVMAAVLTGLFAVGSAAMAADQGSTSGTSGSAAGSSAAPQTGPSAGGDAGVTGLRGTENGPTGRTGAASGSAAGDTVRSPPGGATNLSHPLIFDMRASWWSGHDLSRTLDQPRTKRSRTDPLCGSRVRPPHFCA
jgi:hypothetical protein